MEPTKAIGGSSNNIFQGIAGIIADDIADVGLLSSWKARGMIKSEAQRCSDLASGQVASERRESLSSILLPLVRWHGSMERVSVCVLFCVSCSVGGRSVLENEKAESHPSLLWL